MIRKMTADDAPALANIERACFAKPWTKDDFLEKLSLDTAHYFVYENENGEAVAYIGMNAYLDEGYIDNIAVLPEYRRQGIANALINAAADTAKALHLSFLSLEVRESNVAARNLYEKTRFVFVGMRKNFYSAPKENGVIMTRYFDGEDNQNE